jgi:hypothetical protein
MVRAYILIETAADKAEAVRAAVGHNLGNCLAIGHILWPSEVMVHIECTAPEDLYRAMTQNYPQLEGVRRITPLMVMNEHPQ